MYKLINDKTLCRTALDTPALLNMALFLTKTFAKKILPYLKQT